MTDQLVPVEHEMQVYQTMAKQAVESKFYRNFGDTAAVMSIMLSARELGISPMSALNGGLNIIQGKVEISARMMNALIRRAGHSIITKESTEKACKLIGKRGDTKDSEEVGFTIEEAKNANLVKSGGGWQKFPSDMLYARALSRLARRLFPDVIGCCYVEGEIQATTQESAIPEPHENLESAEMEVVEGGNVYDMCPLEKDRKEFETYVDLVHKKFGVDYAEIQRKFKENPTEFMEKFNKWREKNEK